MKEILFLTLAEIIEIHNDQIGRYGGAHGVRDINLLCSAAAMPMATFDGNFFHNDVYEMAAAYAFHLCQNHPFIDGNKRTALASALVFPELNEISITDTHGALYAAVMDLSCGKLDKAEISKILRGLNR